MVKEIKLSDGSKIPQIGLGLWKVKDESEFKTAFEVAIKAGYRHFDSAQAYQNEQFLGSCVKKSSIRREDLFLTTKIKVSNFGYKKVKKSFAESLTKLQTGYVDLLLLHFPVTILRKKAWKALEEIHETGQAKSIGVSNYTIKHLEELIKRCSIKPAVNQVELHVFLQQPKLIEYCQKNDIVIEAYSPLAHAHDMNNVAIQNIAKKHGKSYAQIMIRWCVEQGFVVLPKSVHEHRIKENIDVYDFKLDSEDKKELANLDSNLRTCWDPTHIA